MTEKDLVEMDSEMLSLAHRMKEQAEILNGTADLANEIIAKWEGRLNEAGIGISTEVRRHVTADERSRLSPLLKKNLAEIGLLFKRSDGQDWKIHITLATSQTTLPYECHEFSSTKRELRFMAIELLPKLLKKISNIADETVAITERIREGTWLLPLEPKEKKDGQTEDEAEEEPTSGQESREEDTEEGGDQDQA